MKTADEILKSIDDNPAYEHWRYNRDELTNIIKQIQIDVLEEAVYIAKQNEKYNEKDFSISSTINDRIKCIG